MPCPRRGPLLPQLGEFHLSHLLSFSQLGGGGRTGLGLVQAVHSIVIRLSQTWLTQGRSVQQGQSWGNMCSAPVLSSSPAFFITHNPHPHLLAARGPGPRAGCRSRQDLRLLPGVEGSHLPLTGNTRDCINPSQQAIPTARSALPCTSLWEMNPKTPPYKTRAPEGSSSSSAVALPP